jgi:hypothetical protein
MIFIRNIHINLKQYIFVILFVLSFLFFSKEVIAQEPPPRPVEVTATTQGLSFGAFTYATTTGTVTVTPAGSRSSTGVVLINIGTPTAALFNVSGTAGTVVTITYGGTSTLFCSCGGTLKLTIDSSNPASSFPLEKQYPVTNPLYVGGTLTVGNSTGSPSGTYTGSFDITLNQE